MSGLPILYSYRRCPYAMRARMALKVASVEVEIREISLREKPKHMLAISPKGTVPVLVPAENQIIDESLDIMLWSLNQHDPKGWLSVDMESAQALIEENDTSFKKALDRYKYADRFPERTQEDYRQDGEIFLAKLEMMLANQDYLLKQTPTIVDIAIFPFIRQFRGVDLQWFESSTYINLNRWINKLIESELFLSIMQKHPTYLD